MLGLFLLIILIFTITGCQVDGNEKQTKIEKPINNIHDSDFENISIETHVKSKLGHDLIRALTEVKRFEASLKSDNDRNRMNSLLDTMSRQIVIDFKKDNPTVDLLIKTNNAVKLIEDSKVVDAMIHKGKENDFVAATVKIIDLEYLAELDWVIGIEPSVVMYLH